MNLPTEIKTQCSLQNTFNIELFFNITVLDGSVQKTNYYANWVQLIIRGSPHTHSSIHQNKHIQRYQNILNWLMA